MRYTRYTILWLKIGFSTLNYWHCEIWLGRNNRGPREMAKFSDGQKKFIIRAFGTTSSPAKIRRLFLQEYKISGRVTVHIVWFYKNKSKFRETGTIFRKKKSECSHKENAKKVEEGSTFVNEKSRSSTRKSAPLFDICTTTYRRMPKKELHMKELSW